MLKLSGSKQFLGREIHVSVWFFFVFVFVQRGNYLRNVQLYVIITALDYAIISRSHIP